MTVDKVGVTRSTTKVVIVVIITKIMITKWDLSNIDKGKNILIIKNSKISGRDLH